MADQLEEYLGRTGDAPHGKIPLRHSCNRCPAPGNPELFQKQAKTRVDPGESHTG